MEHHTIEYARKEAQKENNHQDLSVDQVDEKLSSKAAYYQDMVNVMTIFGIDTLESNLMIQFYAEEGNLLNECFLIEYTNHKQRVRIAEIFDLKDWHHYEIREWGFGMKVIDDIGRFYEIKEGKIIGPA